MPRDVRGSSQGDPRIPITPILKHYGAQEIPEGIGWKTMFCPFHANTNTPSASVNTELELFVCHSCYTKGNAAQLVMKVEDIGYRTAYGRAADIAGSGDSEVHGGSESGDAVPGRSRFRRGNRQHRRLGRRHR